MSSEIERAGDLMQTGLIASQIEGGSGAPGAAHVEHCLDCGAPLSGAYCSACGQRGHVHRSLLHLIEELLHGILHFDAKGWRTIPLLVAYPGKLTRRYVDGQRTRFVSPLALFLFTVFLMFFVASLGHPTNINGTAADNQSAHAALSKDIRQLQQDIAKSEAELAERRKTGADVSETEKQLLAMRSSEQMTEWILLSSDAVLPSDGEPTSDSAAMFQNLSKLHIDTGMPFLDRALRHAVQNPQLTMYKLKNSAYKWSFMLIPISLPFLWLLFVGRRDIGMYDHAVFSLYSLSFMSLWFIVVLLFAFIARDDVISLLMWIPPVHMFLQLRDTYRLGIWSALWRTLALLVVAGTVFLLFLAFILAVTVH